MQIKTKLYRYKYEAWNRAKPFPKSVHPDVPVCNNCTWVYWHRFVEMSPRNEYCNYRYRDFCKRVLSLLYNYERYRYGMPRNGIFKYKCKCQNYRCTLDISHIRVVITRSQFIHCRPITVCSIDLFTRIIQSTLTMKYYIDSYNSFSITCTYRTHINEEFNRHT